MRTTMPIRTLGRAAGGGAGLVGGIIVVGLLLMALAAGVFFLIHAQEAEQQQLQAVADRAEREVADAKAAKEASRAEALRSEAEREREARLAHEAAQIEALAADAPPAARGASDPASKPSAQGEGPPDLAPGAKIRYSLGGPSIQAEVLQVRGVWVQVTGPNASAPLWVNFGRVTDYNVLPGR